MDGEPEKPGARRFWPVVSILLLLTFGAVLLLIFRRGEKPEPPPLPGSDRAAAAAARVSPALERDLAASDLELGAPVFLRAFKEERVLELFARDADSGSFVLFRGYPIAAASGVLGPKLREGDRQVPEGFYAVSAGAMNPNSDFHLSFNIGYPNGYDRGHSRTGSFIMVHGGASSSGCLAMTDSAIEEIYTLCAAALAAGQPGFQVHVFPFRMTEENLAAHAGSPWDSFWADLKEGHDRFERDAVPPTVRVEDGRYVFSAGGGPS